MLIYLFLGIRVVGHLQLGQVKGDVLKVYQHHPHYRREWCYLAWNPENLKDSDYRTRLPLTREDQEAAVA